MQAKLAGAALVVSLSWLGNDPAAAAVPASCRAQVEELCPDSADWGERLACIEAKREQLSPRCQQAVERSLEQAPSAGSPRTARRFATQCNDDFQRLCEREIGAEAPAGAIRECLEARADELSASCRNALTPRAELDLHGCRQELAALCPDRGSDHARMQCARRRSADLPDECIEILRAERGGSRREGGQSRNGRTADGLSRRPFAAMLSGPATTSPAAPPGSRCAGTGASTARSARACHPTAS